MYGTPKDIGIDQGTHITGLEVQERAAGNDLHWCFHHPYSPNAARLPQRMSGVTSATSETGTPLSTCGHTPGVMVPVQGTLPLGLPIRTKLAFVQATGSNPRRTYYKPALGLACESLVVWVCHFMGNRTDRDLSVNCSTKDQ